MNDMYSLTTFRLTKREVYTFFPAQNKLQYYSFKPNTADIKVITLP